MKTIEIKSKSGEVLLAEPIEIDTYNQDKFTVESSDYMVELTLDGLKLKVTNAMNGYGHNCRHEFEDATVDIY